jgi:hypothetical protein
VKISSPYASTILTVPSWILMGFGWWSASAFMFAFGAVSLVALYLCSIDARLREANAALAR